MYNEKRQDIIVAGAADDSEVNEIVSMLRRKNYEVRLSGGKAKSATLAAIAKCKDFIVALSARNLEALKSGASGLSQELRRAMQRQRNVIPVLVGSTGEGFEQLGKTAGLPDETAEFAELHAIEAVAIERRLVSRTRWSRMWTILSALGVIAAAMLGAMLLREAYTAFPRNDSERESAMRLVAAVERSVDAYASGNQGRPLSDAEAIGLVRNFKRFGVDPVALAGILTAPRTRRNEAGTQELAANVAKVLGAVHCEEADAARLRIEKQLGGMK